METTEVTETTYRKMAKVMTKKAPQVKKSQVKSSPPVKSKVNIGYYTQIRSRHPSHDVFRNRKELKFPFRSVIRFGSTTELSDTIANGGKRVELNSTEAIKNSASKLRMKRCFLKGNVKTADWYTYKGNNTFCTNDNCKDKDHELTITNLPYPIVAKSHFGSRGNGNYLLNSQEELQAWMQGKDMSHYLFEKFYSYVREYRIHVSKNGCFYACRKMLKQEFKGSKNAWQRHNDNCVWMVEENPLFDKPNNWKEIIDECIKALESTGLDFGACDVRVQSAKDAKGNKRKEVNFIIIEINSAPSFGDRTEEEYLKELPKLLIDKFKK